MRYVQWDPASKMQKGGGHEMYTVKLIVAIAALVVSIYALHRTNRNGRHLDELKQEGKELIESIAREKERLESLGVFIQDEEENAP